MEIYKCERCGKMVSVIHDAGGKLVCCGEPMKKIEAGVTDAAQEKHVPVYAVEGNKVTVCVGEVEHPMTDEHYIEWIAIETTNGKQRKVLTPSDAPKAEFALIDGAEVKAAYAYCNLHGLWMA